MIKGKSVLSIIGNKIQLPMTLKKVKNVLKNVSEFKFHKDYIKYNKQLKELHNKYKGQRCFIIGTGPSLNETNLSLIKDEISFGVNALYRGMDKFNIKPQYWGISDHVGLDIHYKPLFQIDITLFLTSQAGERFLRRKKHYMKKSKIEPIVLKKLGRMYTWKKFSKDITRGIYHGGTVVVSCIQIAYYMGFKEVYLVGCDCDLTGDYHFDKTGSEIPVSQRVKEWQEKKPQWFLAYEICKKAFEEDGRKIYNSTVGGKLEIFERKSIEEVIGN